MPLIVLFCALIDAIKDTISGRKSNYWEYDYDNYFNLCNMFKDKEEDA